LTVVAGEFWLADRGEGSRRVVFVISDTRFHRLAERAVIAPVLDEMPAVPRPWHVRLEGRAIAVNLVSTISTDRLLERVERAGFETLRRVRHALAQITN
jgi:mRNA-degrading endonuclease toxin of MazEF toxin-antitoxin module